MMGHHTHSHQDSVPSGQTCRQHQIIKLSAFVPCLCSCPSQILRHFASASRPSLLQAAAAVASLPSLVLPLLQKWPGFGPSMVTPPPTTCPHWSSQRQRWHRCEGTGTHASVGGRNAVIGLGLIGSAVPDVGMGRWACVCACACVCGCLWVGGWERHSHGLTEPFLFRSLWWHTTSTPGVISLSAYVLPSCPSHLPHTMVCHIIYMYCWVIRCQ